MDSVEIVEINTKNEIELKPFEEAFYQAYKKNDPEGWAMINMKIINGNRLRPEINYDDLVCFAVKLKGNIIAGVKANFSKNNFQFHKMGFNITEKDKTKNICEGLNFFALGESIDKYQFMNIMDEFSNFYMGLLKKKGIETVFCTCNKRAKIMYLRMGFIQIDNKVINSEVIYLMRYDFS